MRPLPLILVCSVLLACPGVTALRAAAPQAARPLVLLPAAVRLEGTGARQQVVVAESLPEGFSVDRTAGARFRVADPRIARVEADGTVLPLADGVTRLRVEVGARAAEAVVTVRGTRAPRRFSFVNDIEPVLTSAGCNSGPCHGKAEGQHGFKLSVFSYDPEADHAAIVRAGGGRRMNRTDPGRSLLLLKATSALPHGGGQRLKVGSYGYRRLADWIAAGAPYGPEEPRLAGLTLEPGERLSPMAAPQRLLARARYSDGSSRDVTAEARFSSNNPLVATAGAGGRVRTTRSPGEAAVMVSYGGAVATARIVVPRPVGPLAIAPPPAAGFIDRLVWDRLRKLRIPPSGAAEDGEFLRRAYLDALGVLPSPAEARAFLRESAAAPGEAARRALRERLVDRLLERPEFADYWALKWADLLRVNKDRLGAKGAYSFYRWIREALGSNMPYDRFVRELVTASGSSEELGAVNYYRAVSKPEEMASSLSQVLLGVRIECAQCHHHPFEKWSQDDYYGMVGYFNGLKSKPAGAHTVVLASEGGKDSTHPRTGKPVPAHPLLGGAGAPVESGDRRLGLAEWMTRSDNPFLARMIANRVWAHFLGRGLVEPVDDFRDTNPPTNPALLDALARHLVEQRFDFRRLVRAVMLSETYRRSSRSTPANAGDDQGYSHAYAKRLPAEVMMDIIAQATGAPSELPGLPRGTRAVQVWDSEWSTQWQSYFLNVFGRPPRTSPCECERSQEPTIAQVLHLMNSPEIQRQLSSRAGRARQLAAGGRTPGEIIDELFLAAYTRLPTEAERRTALGVFQRAGEDRARAAEDVLWALMNTMEFVFSH